MTKLDSRSRRAEVDEMVQQLQHLMGRPPRPSDQPLQGSVQLSTCPHYGNCLYLMGYTDRKRMSCHKCPVFDYALGKAIADGIGYGDEIDRPDALEDFRPEISRLIKDGGD